MADYYLKSWSNSISAEAQTAGEPALAITTIDTADANITATLVNGDKIHFYQGSGNKKPVLELTSLLFQSGVPSSQWSLCYVADTTEVVVLTGGSFTTGTAARQVPSTADYITNTALAVTDSVHDYYLKVVGTPGASPTGKIFVTLAIVPNTGVAPTN